MVQSNWVVGTYGMVDIANDHVMRYSELLNWGYLTTSGLAPAFYMKDKIP